MPYFDYEMESCQFGVRAPWHANGVSDCGMPAAYYVWWDGYDNGLWLCEEHFKFVHDQEEALIEAEEDE